ncbi:MAG: VTT domain-containing protein, partial [Bacteroidota bacterium]
GQMESWLNFQLEQHQEEQFFYVFISYSVLSADILLPVPSSIVMFMNGAILGIFWGAFLSFLAAMTSSIIGYYLGRSTSTFTNRFFSSTESEVALHFLQRYGWMAILLSRGLPILAETISFLAGNLQYRFRTFFWSNFIGLLPVCLLYAWAGHYAFETQSLLIAFAINIVLAALFWFADRKLLFQQSA